MAFFVSVVILFLGYPPGLVGFVFAGEHATVFSSPAGKSAGGVLRDKEECDLWARHESGLTIPLMGGAEENPKGGLVGARAGAALGSAVGAVSGNPAKSVPSGVSGGAVSGGVPEEAGAAKVAEIRYKKAYALCMISRGYSATQ